MPEIYMDHPQHGATCVFDTGAAEQLKQHGWKVRPANIHAAIVNASKHLSDSVDMEVITKIQADSSPKKRGRPPKG